MCERNLSRPSDYSTAWYGGRVQIAFPMAGCVCAFCFYSAPVLFVVIGCFLTGCVWTCLTSCPARTWPREPWHPAALCSGAGSPFSATHRNGQEMLATVASWLISLPCAQFWGLYSFGTKVGICRVTSCHYMTGSWYSDLAGEWKVVQCLQVGWLLLRLK